MPQLEALLAAAQERDELLGDVVETRALRRSDIIKTALLRSVSHDLRSPITAIVTAAEPLASGARRGRGAPRARARHPGGGAAAVASLIENLLDLSRLEADAAEPRPEWCSLEEVLEASIDDLALPGETFNVSIQGDLPLVRADAAQLERAFANLLENAARHSGGHPVSLRARAVGQRVVMRVVDRGPGIPSAQRERVFEPFYRSGTERSGHRGSGLGLAIARGFVEANGGTIAVESLPGQGTTFVVEFPTAPVPAPSGERRRAGACSSSTTSRRSCGRCASSCATPASRRCPRPRRRRRSISRRCTRRTPRSSTSSCPTATGSR